MATRIAELLSIVNDPLWQVTKYQPILTRTKSCANRDMQCTTQAFCSISLWMQIQFHLANILYVWCFFFSFRREKSQRILTWIKSMQVNKQAIDSILNEHVDTFKVTTTIEVLFAYQRHTKVNNLFPIYFRNWLHVEAEISKQNSNF